MLLLLLEIATMSNNFLKEVNTLINFLQTIVSSVLTSNLQLSRKTNKTFFHVIVLGRDDYKMNYYGSKSYITLEREINTKKQVLL